MKKTAFKILKKSPWLVIFAHLFCCGIPALLSILGGSAIAGGFLAEHTDIQWIEDMEGPLFIFGGLIIVFSIWSHYQNHRHCEVAHHCDHHHQSHWKQTLFLLGILTLFGISLYGAYFQK